MQYIILDLEWNQPINYQNRIYRLYGDRLIFEMIQIGAVRVDEHLNILDSISIPIQPTCYTVIHPRIRSMTHLSEQVLDTAPYFEEALNSFLTWCGTDCIFLTWGCDDVSVFQQNLDFFELHPDLPAFYDIQPLFASAFGMTQRMNLPGAMDLMGLSQEDDKYFHNAAHDAYYTAQVFIHLPHPEEILHYPQQPRSLLHPASKARKTDLFETIAQGLESELAQSPRCAICAKATEIEGERR